jgi:hypothetical protein
MDFEYLSLVVMPHNNALHDLLLDSSLFSGGQWYLTVSPRAPSPPSIHNRGLLGVIVGIYPVFLENRAFLMRCKSCLVGRHRKVECSKPAETSLVFGWLNDAMLRRWIVSATKEAKRVARVDDLEE